MSRFQKIALIAVVSTFIMVVIGVIVRSTGSGMGCPDWPLCHGQVIPPTGDSAAWLEWIHRFWGVVIGFVMLGLVIEAFSSQRATRALTVGSIVALLLTGFQAYLGMRTVALNNSGESVTMHLATAMILLGVTVFLAVRAGYPVAAAAAWREPAADAAHRVHGHLGLRAAALRVPRDRDRAPRSCSPTGRCSAARSCPRSHPIPRSRASRSRTSCIVS